MSGKGAYNIAGSCERIVKYAYNVTLEEALTTDYKGEGVYEEEARTNSVMSIWIHKIFADIRDTYDLSLAQIMARTIRLGTSILEHEYNEQLKGIAQQWAKIRWCDNPWVHRMESKTITLYGTAETGKKVYLRYPVWCAQSLGNMAATMKLRKSDLIQLAIYNAVARSTEMLSAANIIHAEKCLTEFDTHIMDTSVFLCALATKFGKRDE
jgi:hypothetical protein